MTGTGRYLMAWLPMIPIAIVNGAVRQGWYGRHMTELAAHQVSTASAVVRLGAAASGLDPAVLESIHPAASRAG